MDGRPCIKPGCKWIAATTEQRASLQYSVSVCLCNPQWTARTGTSVAIQAWTVRCTCMPLTWGLRRAGQHGAAHDGRRAERERLHYVAAVLHAAVGDDRHAARRREARHVIHRRRLPAAHCAHLSTANSASFARYRLIMGSSHSVNPCIDATESATMDSGKLQMLPGSFAFTLCVGLHHTAAEPVCPF